MIIDKNQVGEGILTEEEEIYKENILDHYKNPRNKGQLNDCNLHHIEFNPLCGDKLEVFIKFEDEKVTNVKFIGNGCAISQASMSLMTEFIKGKSINELRQITREDVLGLLGIPIGVVRMKCALLSLKVIEKGIERMESEVGGLKSEEINV